MLAACVKSTSGPGFTWAVCDSTAPNAGSTTSFAWQHGQVIFRFSPSFSPMAVLYASALKKVGARFFGPPGCNFRNLAFSGLCRRIASREARCRPHLRPNHLRVRCRRTLRRHRGRCTRLLWQRLTFHQQAHFVRVKHFADKQSLRDVVQRLLMSGEKTLRSLVTSVDNPLHFAVNLQRGIFAEVPVLRDFPAQEDGFFLLAERQRPQVAHAPFADHVAGDIRGTLDVVARTSCDVAQENLFGAATAHQHGQHALQELFRVGVLVRLGKLHRQAQRHAARNNRHLVNWIGAWCHRRHQRVSRFVIRGVPLLFVRQDHGLAFHAHQHFVLGHFKIVHRHELSTLPRGPQSRFVHQVRQVGAGKTRRAARDDRKIHVIRKRNLACVYPKNLFAALYVGAGHNHAPVKTPGAKQRRIQNVGTVRRRDQDHAFVRFKSIHFHQQRVQRLFALVVSPAEARSAMPPDRVDFVDEDDAGCILLALLKQVAHAAGAHANEHFNEVRTRNREERHIRFARNCPRQQSLARARRPNKQHTLWNAPAQLLEFLRVLQELDNFLQLFLRLVAARNIFEGRFLLLRGKQPRPRLSETQRLVAARLHLPHQEKYKPREQQQGKGIQKDQNPVAAAHFLHAQLNRLVPQVLGDLRSVFLGDGDPEFPVCRAHVLALHLVADRREVHRHFLHVALVYLCDELTVAWRVLTRSLPVGRNQLPEHHAQEYDRDPEKNCFCRGIHITLAIKPVKKASKNSA